MTVSRFGIIKSETREMSDLERLREPPPVRADAEVPAWPMRGSTFVIVFVAIAFALAGIVLMLRS